MRPECLVYINKAAQNIATYKAAKLINKAVTALNHDGVETMSVLPLHLDRLHTINLIGFSDASLGDPSQLGAAYFLCESGDTHGRCLRGNLLGFSTKARKGLRS
jgi:hypothetical protein